MIYKILLTAMAEAEANCAGQRSGLSAAEGGAAVKGYWWFIGYD